MSASLESEFADKRALVTGGTKGMGEAIVQRLRRSGATVVTASPIEMTTPAPSWPSTAGSGCGIAPSMIDRLPSSIR